MNFVEMEEKLTQEKIIPTDNITICTLLLQAQTLRSPNFIDWNDTYETIKKINKGKEMTKEQISKGQH